MKNIIIFIYIFIFFFVSANSILALSQEEKCDITAKKASIGRSGRDKEKYDTVYKECIYDLENNNSGDDSYKSRIQGGAFDTPDPYKENTNTFTPTPPKSEMKIQGGIEDYCKNRERDESGLLTYDGGVCGGEENGYTAFIDTAK